MSSGNIPYGRQEVLDADVDAVVKVLRSDFLTQGPVVPLFEEAIKSTVGARHAVAVSSATAALHVACAALELGPGDMLWTSPITFVASANCALYCGASVDFCDIDPVTANICPLRLAEKLERASKTDALPKIVVAVHLTGQSCDMVAIGALSKKYGFRVIEDASHAIGGAYQQLPVGSCLHSDIAVFSFHPVKIVTTGEGGAAVTNDDGLARRMELLRSHGITRAEDEMTHAPDGPWYYQQIELGWNYRMTDIHAALGTAQIERLAAYVAKRNVLADRYDAALADVPVVLPGRLEAAKSAWHLYVVRVPEHQHRATFEAMRAEGIGVNLHYIPVHLQPFYAARGFAPGNFPEAEAYYRSAITLPLFPTMSLEDQDRVVAALAYALSK